MFEKKMTLHL